MKLFLTLLIFSSSLWAQDVCCLLANPSSEGLGVTTSAVPMSKEDCDAGSSVSRNSMTQGYRICQALPDPDNLCPSKSSEAICGACGYHWNGKDCLKEDPVQKAKEELIEEMKKSEKEAKEAKDAKDLNIK